MLGAQTLSVRGDADGTGKTELSVAEISLREWWVRQGQPRSSVVFPATKHGVPYRSVSGYKRALATAAQRAGIGHKVNPYLLRHSFATIAWSLDIDKDVARRILRHSDETMLNEVYCRPRPADLVDLVQAFDLDQDLKE